MSTTSSFDPDLERPRGADTWYDVLDVARDVDTAGIVAAYDRAIALVEGKAIGGYFLLDPHAISIARQDIEHALLVLTDDDRRRAYDRSIDGDDADGPSAKPTTTAPPTTSTPTTTSTPPGSSLRFLAPVDDTDSERVAVRRGGIAFATPKTDVNDVKALLQAAAEEARKEAALVASSTVLPSAAMPGPWEPIRPESPRPSVSPGTNRRIELHDTPTPTPTPPPGLFTLDGEVNGQTIRRLREARKMSLAELAELTKIRKLYLSAIEEQDVENLPSGVYLRGFLTQIARVLRVDKVKLAEGYLAFIARFGR